MDIRDFFEFEDLVNEYFYFLFFEKDKKDTVKELLNVFSILSQIEPSYEGSYKLISSNILNLKRQDYINKEISKKFLMLSNLAKKYFRNKKNVKSLLLSLRKEKEQFLNTLKNLNSSDSENKLLTFAITYLKNNITAIQKLLKYKNLSK